MTLGKGSMTKKAALQALANKTSANSQPRGEPKKAISVSSDSLSKYNDESMELIPSSATNNGQSQMKTSVNGGAKSQSQSSVNAAKSSNLAAKATHAGKELSSLTSHPPQAAVKSSMTGLSAATQKGRYNKDSLSNALFSGGKQSQ